jgi:uncharacterized membrane protein YqjE
MTEMTDTSVGGLVRGALDDVRELFREELALARAEMRAEMNKVTASAVRFGAGGVALWFAALFLCVTLALGITALLDWPAWAGFGIVTLLLAVAGLVLVMAGRSAIRDVRPMPRTLHTVKENFR